MLTSALFLSLVVLAVVLTAFIYEIATTPLTPVDAPTLVKAAAAAAAAVSAPAPGLPVRLPRAAILPAAPGPAPRTAAPPASRRRSSSAAALVIAGMAAVLVGGWLFLRIAQGGAACSHQAIEVCSQGYVLLSSTQLTGGAIALAGLCAVVIAAVLAQR